MLRIHGTMPVTVAVLTAFLPTSRGMAEEVTIGGLVAEVPVLSPYNEALDSFRFTAILPMPITRTSTKEQLQLRLDVAWAKPDHFTIAYAEQHSGTPVAFIAEKRLMFYEATTATMTWGDGWCPTLHLNVTKKECEWDLGFTTKEAASFEVDVRPLFSDAGPNPKLKRQNATTWEFRSRSRSGKTELVAIFRPSQPCPLSHLELRSVEEGSVRMAVSDISINEPTNTCNWRCPPFSQLPREVQLEDLKVRGWPDTLGLALRVVGGTLSRRAIDDTKWRIPQLLGEVDWAEAVRTDELVRPILRTLLKVDRDNQPPTENDQRKSAVNTDANARSSN